MRYVLLGGLRRLLWGRRLSGGALGGAGYDACASREVNVQEAGRTAVSPLQHHFC